MAAGVTAGLANGVLTVVGTSPSAPIVVGIYAYKMPRGPVGFVVVEGVGLYPAASVRAVSIVKTASEPLLVRPGANWNPTFRLTNTPDAPSAPQVTAPITAAPSAGVESAAEQAVVDAVNLARKQNGLAPLTVNAKLVQAAQIHAQDMARLDSMQHDLPGASLPTLLDRARYVGYSYSTLGENIAYNYRDTASVMSGWLNSPGHRANILSPGYTQIGVGVAYNGRGEPYYCQVFGRPA